MRAATSSNTLELLPLDIAFEMPVENVGAPTKIFFTKRRLYAGTIAQLVFVRDKSQRT
jgi:hypothetical protein